LSLPVRAFHGLASLSGCLAVWGCVPYSFGISSAVLFRFLPFRLRLVCRFCNRQSGVFMGVHGVFTAPRIGPELARCSRDRACPDPAWLLGVLESTQASITLDYAVSRPQSRRSSRERNELDIRVTQDSPMLQPRTAHPNNHR